jgi:hypothetical protein
MFRDVDRFIGCTRGVWKHRLVKPGLLRDTAELVEACLRRSSMTASAKAESRKCTVDGCCLV